MMGNPAVDACCRENTMSGRRSDTQLLRTIPDLLQYKFQYGVENIVVFES